VQFEEGAKVSNRREGPFCCSRANEGGGKKIISLLARRNFRKAFKREGKKTPPPPKKTKLGSRDSRKRKSINNGRYLKGADILLAIREGGSIQTQEKGQYLISGGYEREALSSLCRATLPCQSKKGKGGSLCAQRMKSLPYWGPLLILAVTKKREKPRTPKGKGNRRVPGHLRSHNTEKGD